MGKAIVLCMVLLCPLIISGKILAEEKWEAEASLCDPDGSRRVDGFDAGNIGIAFGSKKGDKRYNEKADCNNDGVVNNEDLKIANMNFGKTIPPENPETQRKGPKPPTGFREK